MRGMWIAAVAMFAFGLGCVAASFVVQPVRAGTNPTRWEYCCLDSYSGKGSLDREISLVDSMNALGAEGWELAAGAGLASSLAGANFAFCFKRPL